MARASTPTLLPLDRWAAIVGIEPRHFNQVTVATLAPTTNCKSVWTQYAWQAVDAVGREEIAQAIQRAEADIIEALGYYPIPQWIDGEVVRTKSDYYVESLGCSNLMTPAGRNVSVRTAFGHVISGGLETHLLIANVTVLGGDMVWQDLDGDGYFETARLTFGTTVTDVNELRVYFTGTGMTGEDIWEVRPLRSVTIAAGIATILIDRHLLVDPDLWEAMQPGEVDGLVNANFVNSLDIYRVYNDPSQQAQMQWERTPGECNCGSATCAMCAWSTQWACLQTRDPRLGIVTYMPATWNVATQQYDAAAMALDRRPERVRLYYRAGYESTRVKRPMVEMDPTFEQMIARYSICLLDRPICSCSNVEGFHNLWTEDRALISETGSYRFNPTFDHNLACPWGTQRGALDAWKQVNRMKLGTGVEY